MLLFSKKLIFKKYTKIRNICIFFIEANPLFTRPIMNSLQYQENTPIISGFLCMKQHIHMLCIKKNMFINTNLISRLSANPNAVQWLENNIEVINWFYLSKNPNALHLLTKNPDKINWYMFSKNSANEAIDLLINNPHKIYYDALCLNTNPLAYNLLIQHPSKIDWNLLSLNSANYAIELLINNPHKINWQYFSSNANPRAYDFLKKNAYNIDYSFLNLNPNAVNWLNENPDFIDWQMLSRNDNAIELIEKNHHKISWNDLGKNLNGIHLYEYMTFHEILHLNDNYLENPSIFEYDYKKIKERISKFKEELIQKVWSPSNVIKWVEQGFDDFLES